MAFTDNSDLFVSFHEDGFNWLLFHVMHRVRPYQSVAFRINTESRIAVQKTGKAPDEADRVLHRLFRADAPAQNESSKMGMKKASIFPGTWGTAFSGYEH